MSFPKSDEIKSGLDKRAMLWRCVSRSHAPWCQRHILKAKGRALFHGASLDDADYLKILSNSRFIFPSFPCFQVLLAELNFLRKNTEDDRLSLFIELFLYDFTLFGIDIHKNILISLIFSLSISSYFGNNFILKKNPSKMEVAPQGCLHVISQKTNNQINWVRIDIMG